MADRLLDEHDTGLRLELAYSRILGRLPRPDERPGWQEFLATFDDAAAAWQSLCRVLVSSNEFVFIE
jgi:hypothetical protein